jgi:hypothetical protein
MGDVFRAKDTRLKRDVAIKIIVATNDRIGEIEIFDHGLQFAGILIAIVASIQMPGAFLSVSMAVMMRAGSAPSECRRLGLVGQL